MNEESYVFLERFGKPGGGKGILVSSGFCPTLTSQQLTVCTEEYRMKDEPMVYDSHPMDSRVTPCTKDISQTLSTRFGGENDPNTILVREPIDEHESHYVVRRITPKECERLQGFPDDYTKIPWKDGKPCPDSHRYKALGNSMAVPVMRWIGERIDEALDDPIVEDTSDPVGWQPELF